ncbi:MAG TPA: serine/threonine-protein kinase [Candidatus Acidoferrum sp.]|nr:serine/threonine-protein kinase [Candidatus Acidoferrum sp.]
MNLAPYTIVGEIGRGGMGVVLKAIDSRDARVVAIKLIQKIAVWNESSRIALVREAGATASLQHPNIVSIYDVNQYKGNIYLVMEYLDGVPLEQLIRKRYRLGLKHKLQFVVQICQALAYAHERGVVHRDIKPQNVFILRNGTVKVLDFGLAAVAQIAGSSSPALTGTVPYMSPEQVARHNLDGRSDIWSVGVTFFQLLTGSLPFPGPGVLATFRQILNDPVPELPETIPLSHELSHVLLHALHKDREKRYSSAHLFAEDLRQLIPVAQAYGRSVLPAEVLVADGLAQATLDTFSLVPERQSPEETASGPEQPASGDAVEAHPGGEGLYHPLNLALVRKPQGKVVISAGRFSWTSAARKLTEVRSNVMRGLIYLTFIANSVLMIAQSLNGIFFLVAISALAVVWLSMSAAILAMWLLGKLDFYPRCPACGLPMWRRSGWTRFVKSKAEVVLGYRDCLKALETSFWEDAAKLLCIHGAEFTSMYASRSIDCPLRYSLEIFECGTCVQRAARLTTDESSDQRWLTRPEFVQANQGADNQEARLLQRFAALPRRILFICLDLFKEILKVPFNAKVAAFTVASCLILALVGYSAHKDHRPIARKLTDAEKLGSLGDKAYFGFGRVRDLPLAATYYHMAAESGDVASARRLAGMLEHGEGVSVDLPQAFHWYQFAAIHGNADAQYNLGRFYENGLGVPVDLKQALRWYQESASRRNASADYSLGRFYENGIGVQKDPEQALVWYRYAATLGNQEAQKRLLSLQLRAQGSGNTR